MPWSGARRLLALAALVAACGRTEPASDVSEPSPTKTEASPRRPSSPPETPTPAAIDALLADLRSDDDAVAAKARAALVASGPAAVDALLAWLAITDEDDDRSIVAYVLLQQTGGACVPGAVRLLEHADHGVRYRAVNLLHDVRGFWVRADDGPDVARALLRLWDDSDEYVRKCVRDKLPTLTPAADCIAAALAARLDPKDEATLPTLVSLSLLGDAASPAAPRIAEFLSSDDENLRTCAAETLRMLGPNAATALPQIAVVLETGTSAQRALALDAIEAMRGATASIAPALIKLLDDDEFGDVAAERLGACGAAGPEVVAALARALDRRDEDHRADGALTALWSIADDCPARHDDVARLLLTGRTETRAALLLELGSRPAWTGEAVACLRDPDVEIRRAALAALARLDTPIRSAIDAVAAATADADPIVRLTAIRAAHAWKMDVAKPSIDGIGALLASDDSDVRREAVFALSAVAPDVARFRAALRDENVGVRCAALQSLGEMGAAASEAASEVAASLTDPTLDGIAAVSLGRIGVANEAIVDALAKALASADADYVRSDILDALRRLGPAASRAAPAVAAVTGSGLEDDVARTLAAINPDRDAAVESVLASKVSTDEQIKSLAQLGAPGAAAILRAVARRKGNGTWVAWSALKDLGDVAPPVVVAATRSPDSALRAVAIDCLELVDRATALSILDGACGDGDARVRAAAAATTERFADADADVGPLAGRIVAMLSDADVGARTSAVSAVGRLGAAGAVAVPRLRTLLAEGPMAQRVAAGAALHRLTGDVDGVLPVFEAVLRAPCDYESIEAWRDVGRCAEAMGPRAAPLADAMGSALLRSRDRLVQVLLLDALATFGPAAAPALPAVRAALGDELHRGEDHHVWSVVDRAIPVVAAMGPAAAPALRELRALNRSPEHDAAVADAIRKITAPR